MTVVRIYLPDRHATEFSGRHNNRPADTLTQIHQPMRGMDGKRLRYQNLIDYDTAYG